MSLHVNAIVIKEGAGAEDAKHFVLHSHSYNAHRREIRDSANSMLQQ